MNRHRGLSLLELMLAMAITVMVAAAITAMLGAVTSGVGTRRDNRTVMILANAAETRLAAYVAPARCLLDKTESDLVLWFDDARSGETIHATELRWISFDAGAGTISASYVMFPAAWSQAAQDLEDYEYASSSDWNAVFAHYQASGWLSQRVIADNLEDVKLTMDAVAALDCRHITYLLSFSTESGSSTIAVATTMLQHSLPLN